MARGKTIQTQSLDHSRSEARPSKVRGWPPKVRMNPTKQRLGYCRLIIKIVECREETLLQLLVAEPGPTASTEKVLMASKGRSPQANRRPWAHGSPHVHPLASACDMCTPSLVHSSSSRAGSPSEDT